MAGNASAQPGAGEGASGWAPRGDTTAPGHEEGLCHDSVGLVTIGV